MVLMLFFGTGKSIILSGVSSTTLLSCKGDGSLLLARTVCPCLISGANCSPVHWMHCPHHKTIDTSSAAAYL